jgi:hypothetical protein
MKSCFRFASTALLLVTTVASMLASMAAGATSQGYQIRVEQAPEARSVSNRLPSSAKFEGLDSNGVVSSSVGLAQRFTVQGTQIIYDTFIENLGDTDLASMTLTDQLLTVYGFGNYIKASGPTFIVDPGTITLNSSFDGLFSPSVISSGTLVAGGKAQIRFVMNITNVTNQGSGFGIYPYSATISTTDTLGISPTDTSDDGILVDANGNGIANEAGENDTSTATIGEELSLGAALTVNMSGPVATFDISLENLGNSTANNVSLIEDLAKELGAAGYSITSAPTLVDDPGTLTLNGAYDGSSDRELISSGTLESGDTAQIHFVVDISAATGSGNYSTRAIVSGDTGSTTFYADYSDNGTDPDPDGNGEPGSPGEDDPTPFSYLPAGSIGDFVWNDLNGDGVQDGGEPGLSGVTVFLDLNSNGTLDGGEPSAVTDGSGAYAIASVSTGTYSVRVDATTIPAGFVLTGGTVPLSVALAAGETVTSADFGYQQQDASIGDFVWNDLNGDGVQDGGEPGLSGVTVFLDLNSNGTLDGGEPSDTTDGTGVYGFSGLATGAYSVRVDTTSLPSGFVLSGGTMPLLVNLAAGEVFTSADFGYQQQDASIGDFVWNDLNGDGVQDGGEPGLAGVTVFLDLNSNGTLDGGEPSDTTDGTGVYGFSGLATGAYSVRVDTTSLPSGFVLSGGTMPLLVNLAAGEVFTSADFGYQQQDASIGDFVWNDLNGDGVQDGGEPGLAGVTVFLDLNSNGTLDGGEPSDTTDGTGVYGFSGLATGAYSVRVDTTSLPSGFVLSGGTMPLLVNLAAGEVFTSADFGYQQQDASIGDFVWNDLNGDGVQDGGEPGLSGITVFLDLNSNGTLDGGEPSAVTDGAGAYAIASVSAGTYSVRVDATTVPAGFVLTGGTTPLAVTLAAGEVFTTADFGYQQQDASIGDFVWNDLNGDGVQDGGEPGLSGVTVFLDLNTNGTLDGGEPSAVTDGAGAYAITGLAAGTYSVRVDAASVPSGYVLTGGTIPLAVTLTTGEVFNTADFGYQQQDASIGDFVWNDLNGNGVQDGGEPGLSGVTVFLDLNTNGTLDGGEPSAATDGAGAYAITGLAAGAYSVRVDAASVPSGFVLTGGTIPLAVTLATGEVFTTADFGYQPLATNAGLSDLALSDGTLNPAFATNITSYTADVGNATTSITVTPTLADPNATVTVNGAVVASGSASGPINLNLGANTISVVVTAQDGMTSTTYTIVATRQAAIGPAVPLPGLGGWMLMLLASVLALSGARRFRPQ